MFFSPLDYDEPVFRPPAEAASAILQVTIGCSWNKCAFCEMYSSKKFRIRDFDDVQKDINNLFLSYNRVKRFFLADGDAMMIDSEDMLRVLEKINSESSKFNNRLQRISSYALPKNILSKSSSELVMLREAGLKLLYVGIETGDDELLGIIKKGETYHSTVDGIKKAHNAGIDTSIMILNGLGGRKYSEQHAKNSAKIINELNPKYLSTLTLSFPMGIDRFSNKFQGEYIQQTTRELMEELYLFLSLLDVENVIFRSNHVSNNVSPAGTFPKDKKKVLNMLESAIYNTPEGIMPENPIFL